MTQQQRHKTVTGIILIASALLVLIVVALYLALLKRNSASAVMWSQP